MRLARHMLRDNTSNKRAAVRYIPLLQEMLGLGLQVAETLREIFANNAEVLDLVTDDHVTKFIELIRTSGRHGRYVDFLRSLTQCNDKAVRPNQWRICRLFLQEAPELLLTLSLKGSSVFVSGDPRYFPALAQSGPMELTQWLETTTAETAVYFERCVELCALLVKGRNLKAGPVVQVWSSAPG
jgi:hypothetical protein